MTDVAVVVSTPEEPPDRFVGAEAERVFELFERPHVRTVFAALDETPRTVQELRERCGVSQSTLYRCLDDLAELPLVETSIRVSDCGRHAREYACPVDDVVVSFTGSDGVHLAFVP